MMTIEKFKSAVSDINGLPTDRIVEILDHKGFWDPAKLELVQLEFKRDYVRRMLGRVRTDDGQRLFINLEIETSKGRRLRVYKNRQRMSVDEFRQAIKYYHQMGMKGVATAKSLIRDCRSIHGVQLRLPFAGN